MASIDLSRLIQEQIMQAGKNQNTEPITESKDAKIADALLQEAPDGSGGGSSGTQRVIDNEVAASGPDKGHDGMPGSVEVSIRKLMHDAKMSYAEAKEHVLKTAGKVGTHMQAEYPKYAVGAGALAAGAGLYKYLKAKKASK